MKSVRTIKAQFTRIEKQAKGHHYIQALDIACDYIVNIARHLGVDVDLLGLSKYECMEFPASVYASKRNRPSASETLDLVESK